MAKQSQAISAIPKAHEIIRPNIPAMAIVSINPTPVLSGAKIRACHAAPAALAQLLLAGPGYLAAFRLDGWRTARTRQWKRI